MASGLPIVCRNICDNPYIVEFGANGFLFNPESPEDIASKLIAMINYPNQNKTLMAQLNGNKIVEMCAPQNFVNKYLALI